MYFHTFHTKIH